MKVVCGQLLTVGPRVNPENLEWWASGTEGWENLHLRVIGTRDQVYCERFFWSSNTIWPRLRFEDGGSEYSLRSVFESKNRGTAEAPRKLLETVSAR